MMQQFECCWQSMRDVPQATIDMGDGQVIERTIGGNVITWFCLSDGRAFDAQPGLLDEASYRAALRSAAESHRSLMQGGQVDPEDVQSDLTARASRLARAASNGWAVYLESLLAPIPPSVLARHPADRLDSIVEPFAASREPPALQRALLKRTIELPLVTELLVNQTVLGAGPEDPWAMLAQETELSRNVLRPQVLGLLGCVPLSTPADLAPHVYRLVFASDLDDPFLGMAPPVLGRRDAFTAKPTPKGR